MIDKKEAKNNYKMATKIGAVIAYRNLTTNQIYIDIAQDLPSIQNRFEFAKKTGIGLPFAIEKDAKNAEFSLEVLEELKKDELQTDKAFKEDLTTLKEIWTEKMADENLY